MAPVRFTCLTSTPPGGIYEYEVNGEVVRDTSRIRICRKVVRLRQKHNLPVVGDGFRYVMEYMCPRLPDGFCTKPGTVTTVSATEIKQNTIPLFPQPLTTSDNIEKRIEICIACPMHSTRGYCMDCGNLLDWIYSQFGTRRPRLPADHITGICMCDKVLTAANVSVASRPPSAGVEYPAGCWRTKEA